MSKEKNQPTKSTTTTAKVKRSPGRPKKTAETKVTVVNTEAPLPKSVKPLATAQARKTIKTKFVINDVVRGDEAKSAQPQTKEPSIQDVMTALEGVKRSLITEAQATREQHEELIKKADIIIKIGSDVKDALNEIKTKRTLWEKLTGRNK